MENVIDEGCAALLKVEAAVRSITQCLESTDLEVKRRVLEVLIKLQGYPGEPAPYPVSHYCNLFFLPLQHLRRPLKMLLFHSLLSSALEMGLMIL